MTLSSSPGRRLGRDTADNYLLGGDRIPFVAAARGRPRRDSVDLARARSWGNRRGEARFVTARREAAELKDAQESQDALFDMS